LTASFDIAALGDEDDADADDDDDDDDADDGDKEEEEDDEGEICRCRRLEPGPSLDAGSTPKRPTLNVSSSCSSWLFLLEPPLPRRRPKAPALFDRTAYCRIKTEFRIIIF
jgi:hypothetical protein